MFDRKPIFGHIRFSFYGITDTRSKPDEDGSALARLYDETRMARRFFLFESLTLPGLLQQSDSDFRTVIMSSDVMPDRYKERLNILAARLPGAVVEYSHHRRGDRAFRSFMIQAAGRNGLGHSVHFRLDDDDAVSVDFISRLRAISRFFPPSTHITFPSGIFLFPSSEKERTGLSMVRHHLLSAQGLATINGQTFQKNPFQMMHGNVWKRWPVVSEPRFPAFIRTLHFDNDTVALQDRSLGAIRQERTSRRAPRHAASVERHLAQGFPWIDRPTLDGLIGRCDAVKSMADLPPVLLSD